ncbi:peptide transporter [Olsenella sp. oral taxon 807]|uniref:OPT/YSL family transporter n=1 Tax=Olsenella sp. oral taxon 807 TaxID=712411 RepID=UPI00067A17D6|nr:OPT/YSL family transporter [Olsenella sp. oral taxon 807]AKT48029.1 peptide transporter [Olsenella sp. oral taxon 807]
MDENGRRTRLRDELSVPGFVIGIIGCVILTATSAYTALKMGALPWPTIFTSVTSLLLLRAFGRRDIAEANVTQIVMSAGSMVAGGLAFTIPGVWMLGLPGKVSWWEMLFVALAGTLLGLVCTALIRRRFVDDSTLSYPIGTAAAETLKAAQVGGSTGIRLFGSMGLAGLWCVLRDGLNVLPQFFLQLTTPGVNFAIYNSPMLLSMGYLVGFVPMLFWLGGGVVANLGLIAGATAAGAWSVEVAQKIVKSLGMGLMMGAGIAVVLKDVLPQLMGIRHGRGNTTGGKPTDDEQGSSTSHSAPVGDRARWASDVRGKSDAGFLALLTALAALTACFGLSLGPIPTVIIVILSFVTTIMSAQSTGQTGIDPMEIFGLIVLLLVAAVSNLSQLSLFFVAGIITVACGLAGDVMSDFKTGSILGNNPRTLWKAQALGALIGVFVAVATMVAIEQAYGPDTFGPNRPFIATQASVVATMVSGIPSVPAFMVGLVAGIVIYCLGLPAMMVGLGVYLPLYMTVTASLGAAIKLVLDKRAARRRNGLRGSEGGDRSVDETPAQDDGIVVASGVLGGESIVGVTIAFVTIVRNLG